MPKNRSKSRERFLDKMFLYRQQLKNKFNYYESHPWESRIFDTTITAYHINVDNPYSVFQFAKIWRKKMDGMFDLETYQYKRQLILQMLKEETQHRQAQFRPNPPRSCRRRRRPAEKMFNDSISRILLNYDREVLATMREINREFNHYIVYPHRYLYINNEIKIFLELHGDKSMDLDVDFQSQEFQHFWNSRAAVLCDQKVKFEKNLLRLKWRFAVRNHMRLSNDPKVKDLQSLLESEDETDSDVEAIDCHVSMVDLTSDQDFKEIQ